MDDFDSGDTYDIEYDRFEDDFNVWEEEQVFQDVVAEREELWSDEGDQ